MNHFRAFALALFLCGTTEADEPLGKLSEKYESGGRGPGTVSTDKGDPGGVSYGTYQLASKIGRADEFTKKWKELAEKDPKGLHAKEHAFIKETHYDPQVRRLEKDLKLDVTKRSAALRDVVWSVAVQHGPNTDVIVTAVKPLLKDAKIEDVTDEAIIRAVFAERGRKDKDGKLVRFKGVSDDWIPALTKRFDNELKDALEMLKK